MQIANNKVVSIHYKLTNKDNQILDSSEGQEPLQYIHGIGYIVPGLEKALNGKSVGDKIHVSLTPEEGYGQRNEDLVQTLDRGAFEGIDNIQTGMEFQAESEAGIHLITVTHVEGDKVTVDGNHPLAGEPLTFDVEITAVRAATSEELNHSHVHDGHQH